MFQLKAYNANVFTSTPERCRLTLDLFSFGKVIALHMKRRAPEGMLGIKAASWHAHAMAVFRQQLEQGLIAIPKSVKFEEWRDAPKRNKRKRTSSAGPAKRQKY